MANNKPAFFGKEANEDWSLFIFNKNSTLPVIIENIGYTHKNPRYRISRTESDLFVFEYVISGTGYIEMNNQKYKVEAGDVYCIEPGHDHVYYSDPHDPFEKIWINFYSQLFVNIFKSFNIAGKVVFKQAECHELFSKLQQLARTTNFSDELCYDIAPVLFEIVCTISEKSNQQLFSSPTASEIKRILDQSIYESITMDDIADQLHLNKSYIIREFSKYYGYTPYNYLLNQKIAIAKKMIALSQSTIGEISDKLAFSDAHYFSRLFKSKTGLSPQAYRKRKRNYKKQS